VPSNTAKSVIPRLARGEAIRRPYLGVSTSPGASGPVVADITAGGPAERAGLRTGDVIVEVGGERVRTPDDVSAAIENRAPGDEVKVVVEQNGGRRTFDVELGTRPAQSP